MANTQPTSITIITDCLDDNAKSRQIVRVASLFPNVPISFIGITNTLAASGNIIDTLDALYNTPGIILANVAPRDGEAKKWENGTPFGYSWVDKTLIVGTIDGYTFSLLKKFNLIEKVHVTDLVATLNYLTEAKIIHKEDEPMIKNTQFRSLNYMPRLAKFIWDGGMPKTTELKLHDIPNAPHDIWWVDNFGNRKTTLTVEDISIDNGVAKTSLGHFNFYKRLKDVPDGEEALIEGSSGYKEVRFLEIVRQGTSY